MTRVAHIMTPLPETIASGATAADAGRKMAARNLRHLPVVDDAGRLVGMLSDRDLRGPMVGSDRERPAPTADALVSSLMTRDVVSAGPDDDLGAVARAIVDHRIGAVPVVDAAGTPIGILSVVDVLRRLAEDAEADARAVDAMDAR